MIYTVTPNPTLDLGGVVDQLTPNEKNYVHNETKSPGGNAINAARIMKRLGSQVMATGFIGGGIGHVVVRDFTNRDHPISSERDHLVRGPRSVSDGSYLRAAPLSTFLADSDR
jgi:fructose-1-phosphate kinase PfkB-like protein